MLCESLSSSHSGLVETPLFPLVLGHFTQAVAVSSFVSTFSVTEEVSMVSSLGHAICFFSAVE